MSRTVKIDYEGISIECQSTCEMASGQLCKLNTLLERIEAGATTLLNEQTKALRQEIERMRNQLQAQINSVVEAARENAERYGTVYTDFDFDSTHKNARNPIYEARKLRSMANEMFSTRIAEMESLLNKLLKERVQKESAERFDKAMGVMTLDGSFMTQLNSISDTVLQQYIYIEWVNDNKRSFDEMRIAAEEARRRETAVFFEQHKEEQRNELRSEMKNAGVTEEVIQEVMATTAADAQAEIQTIREKATNEIIGEAVRKETVKVISKAIKARGFIIPKGGTKLQREKNQVVIQAQKPSGETAEFIVMLNGHFIYKFHGYEGEACKNDIEPFMSDLEKVYGHKVLAQEVIWSNPDKISTQKHQAMNSNHNKA